MSDNLRAGRELDRRIAEILELKDLEYSYVTETGGIPDFSTDHAAARLLEDEIERRGLVEKYQNALIDVFGFDMQVFNSAIEISSHAVCPSIPNNTFQWQGHAFLWALIRATPEQKARAFLEVVKGAVG